MIEKSTVRNSELVTFFPAMSDARFRGHNPELETRNSKLLLAPIPEHRFPNPAF